MPSRCAGLRATTCCGRSPNSGATRHDTPDPRAGGRQPGGRQCVYRGGRNAAGQHCTQASPRASISAVPSTLTRIEEGAMRHQRVIVTHYGGPDALRVVEEECPEPKDGEVRVKVLSRRRCHARRPGARGRPSRNAARALHAGVGSGWRRRSTRQRCHRHRTGPDRCRDAHPRRYAQFVCLPQRELVPVPAGLDAAEAVSLMLNYITAYQMLHRSAKVKRGQRVLFHGASGGVGTALLQLGRLAGLEMYGTCSRAGHRPFPRWAASPSITGIRTT